MSQLSLFSADARPARLGDLGGLLCGPARIDRFGGVTARVAVAVGDDRVPALRAAAAVLGIALDPDGRSCAGPRLRTAYRKDLAGLARSWIGPGGKTVPQAFQLDGAGLRLWVLAGGRPDGRGGYLLPLDPTAPATHAAVIAAVTRLGLPPARVLLPPCPVCRGSAGAPDVAGAADGPDGASPAPETLCRQHHRGEGEVVGEGRSAYRAGRVNLANPGPGPDTASIQDPASADARGGQEAEKPGPPAGARGRYRADPIGRSSTADEPGSSAAREVGWHPVDSRNARGHAALALRHRPRPSSAPEDADPPASRSRAPDDQALPSTRLLAGAECAAAGPALRISGIRRLQRLVELVGPPPPGVDPEGWPRYWGRRARPAAG